MKIIDSPEFAYSNTREKILYFLSLVIIIALSLFFIFPFYWMFKGALQPPYMATQLPPSFLPINLTIQNFINLFNRFPISRWIFNSFVVASSATILTLIFGSLSGYAFAKRRFPGREFIFWLLLTAMMVPKQIMLVPLYVLMNNYGLYNTHAGMFLPMVAWPFGLFLMRQFMVSIPDELIQAAKVDGASEPFIFLRIIVPLSVPAFGTVGIIYFVRIWNDYLWQLTMASETRMNTLPVGIAKMVIGEVTIDYGLLMSGAALGAVPMMFIFLSLQKYFIKGLTVGSIKG